jgi:3-(3-hydroxy-phenyl)propionate hydroxylase
MAPPNHGFRLLREAALRLATEDAAVAALLNPRQSTPVDYVGSPLKPGRAGKRLCRRCACRHARA